jgi:hypothetical protein
MLDIAARVFVAITDESDPDSGDVARLLASALPDEAQLPLDQLALRVIKRELQKRQKDARSR